MNSHANEQFDQLKRDRQADVFRSQLIAAGLANLFNGTLLAAVYLGPAPAPLVVGWWVITAAIAARTTFMGLRQRRRARQGGTTPETIRRMELATMLTGVVWGAGAAIFFPYGSLPEQLLLAFVIAGTAAGASAGLNTLPRANIIFLFAILLPVALWLLVLGGEVRWIMAAMTTAFFVVLCLFSRAAYRSFLAATQYQLEASQQSALLETMADVQSLYIDQHDAKSAFDALLDKTIQESNATIAILAELPDGGGELPVLAARGGPKPSGSAALPEHRDLPIAALPYTGLVAKSLGRASPPDSRRGDAILIDGVDITETATIIPLTGSGGPIGVITLAAPGSAAPVLSAQRRAATQAVATSILIAHLEQRDRRTEQAAFSELADHNRIILQNIDEGILVIDSEGIVIRCNDSARRLFLDPDLIGTPIRKLFPEWESKHLIDLKDAESGQRADGSTFPALISANKAHNRGTLMFVVTVQDLTARQNLQVELERFFSTSIDLFFVADLKGFFRYNNAAWSRSLQIEPRQLLAHPFIEFVHPDDRESTMAEYGRLAEGGHETIAFENRFVSSDGSSRSFVWNVSFNEPMGRIYGVGRDVTDQRKLEEMKGNFVSLVSHELRTPLTSISASLGILDDANIEVDTEETRELVSIARKNSDRLIRLVNDILDLQKLDGAAPADLEGTCALGSTIIRALDEMRGFASEHGVTVELNREADYDPTVPVHEDRIIQIMTNLVSNAVKYTPDGGVVTCTVEPSPKAGMVRLSVEDQGSGVPIEFRDQLFSRFARAETEENRKLTGTGLGLSICKSIVDAAGGEISFFSPPGKGATFYCDLPVSTDG